VRRGAGERAQVGLLRAQWCEHLLLVRLARRRGVAVVRVGEQMRRVVDEGVGRLDRRPQRRRRRQALPDQAQ